MILSCLLIIFNNNFITDWNNNDDLFIWLGWHLSSTCQSSFCNEKHEPSTTNQRYEITRFTSHQRPQVLEKQINLCKNKSIKLLKNYWINENWLKKKQINHGTFIYLILQIVIWIGIKIQNERWSLLTNLLMIFLLNSYWITLLLTMVLLNWWLNDDQTNHIPVIWFDITFDCKL